MENAAIRSVSPDVANEQALQEILRLRQRAAASAEDLSLLLDLGNAEAAAGQTIDAIGTYGVILKRDPNCGHAWNNLGNLFDRLGDREGALLCFQNAIRLLPQDATAHYSVGRALNMLGRDREALEYAQTACLLRPNHADASVTLGNVQQHLGQWEDALRSFDSAVRLAPDWAEPHVNRAMVLLNLGKFRDGWREYAYRWQTPAFRVYRDHPFPSPRWNGEPLAGKRILLFAEQGFGDAVQFARFIPWVQNLGAEIFLELRPPLLSLFRHFVEADHLIAAGSARPATDFHCSLLDLPEVLDVGFDTLPNAPYLTVAAEESNAAAAVLRQAVSHPSLPRVGLVWRGNPSHPWDRKRSLALPQLAPLAQVKGIQWVCLQAGATAQELSAWPGASPLAVLPDGCLDGFANAAAILNALDLVVCVDTAYAHLAGALGKPVWLLLNLFYEWRWHAHLDDSPWYPSARLFRQHEPGEWQGAVEHAAANLSTWRDTWAATRNPV